MAKYTIQKLDDDDWRIFRAIRLRALAADSEFFGSTFERESNQSEAEWRQALGDDDVAIFVMFENSEPIGMTGVSVYGADASGRTAILWGSWLAPEFRGKGLSNLFYEVRLNWAREHPSIERVIVSHRASNLTSKAANQRFGFVFTRVTERKWNDGSAQEEFHYELNL